MVDIKYKQGSGRSKNEGRKGGVLRASCEYSLYGTVPNCNEGRNADLYDKTIDKESDFDIVRVRIVADTLPLYNTAMYNKSSQDILRISLLSVIEQSIQ